MYSFARYIDFESFYNFPIEIDTIPTVCYYFVYHFIFLIQAIY